MHAEFSLPPDALARMEMFRDATSRRHVERPPKFATEQARRCISFGIQDTRSPPLARGSIELTAQATRKVTAHAANEKAEAATADAQEERRAASTADA